MTLSQWQQAANLDSNSVIAIPVVLFVNVGADDYHLLSNSPAKDLGRLFYYSASAPLTDNENTSRPQDVFPDAGAYEYKTVTGTMENFRPLNIVVYPNPAGDQLTVYGLQSRDFSYIEIYNILGEKKCAAIDYSGGVNSLQLELIIDIASLSPGVYFIKLQTKMGMIVRKFIKE